LTPTKKKTSSKKTATKWITMPFQFQQEGMKDAVRDEPCPMDAPRPTAIR